MRLTTQWGWTTGLVSALAVLVIGGWAFAEAPAAPKVSTYAPPKDLAAAVDKHIARMEEAVASEADYKDFGDRNAKDANTLVLLALAAGLHDQENKYKETAPALMKAAQAVAKAKSFEAAKAAVAEVKKAAETGKGNPTPLKWEKVADLVELMKAVPLVNNRLKRNVRPTAFKKKSTDNGADSATLGVIAQGSIADTSQAKGAEQEKQWQEFCAKMRDAAAAVNKEVHAGDQPAADKAMANLIKSCDTCHEVFHKDQVGKSGDE
jgi:hypothetical protein